MKEVAAGLIVASAFMVLAASLLFSITGANWSFQRSPNSGICYEKRLTALGLSISGSISPVDSKFCK